jgi:hypothetical protein
LDLQTTNQPNFTWRPTLDRRYHLIGLVLPTFLTLYFFIFGERILSRPEGFAVLWWMQVVMDSIAGAAKTVQAFAKSGVSEASIDYASLAFAIFVFAFVLNSIIQIFLGFRIRLDTENVKLNHDGLRRKYRLDPKLHYFLLFILCAGFLFFFLFNGFSPKWGRGFHYHQREFRGFGIFFSAMLSQYSAGALMMYAIALVRHKAI